MKRAHVLAALAFLLLLSSPIFSSYVENIEVRVLDQLGRVVPGAQVNATYEISKSRGAFTTKTQTTNERGRAQLSLYNVEFVESATNKDYVIHAKFGSSRSDTGFTAGAGEYPRTVRVSAYLLNVYVTDRESLPVNAVVGADGEEKQAPDGFAYFMLSGGQHEITAKMGDVVRSKSVSLSSDASMNITIVLYNLSVRALDDRGQPLQADIYVGPTQKKTGLDGMAYFEKVTDLAASVTAYFGRFKKVANVSLEGGDSVTFAFDTHPPAISDVNSEWKGKFLQVRAAVADNGTYASGLRGGDSSIKLQYVTLNGTEREVPMYGIGYNLYEGLIPSSGVESQIKYTILATDADGNRKASSDTFVLPTNSGGGRQSSAAEPPLPRFNTSANDENNLAIFGIAAIVAILAGIIYIFRNQLPFFGGGLAKPPPRSPPPPPPVAPKG